VGFLGVYFGGFLGESVIWGLKTHCGHCGTVEFGQNWGDFGKFFSIFYDFLRFLEENGRILCCFWR